MRFCSLCCPVNWARVSRFHPEYRIHVDLGYAVPHLSERYGHLIPRDDVNP